MNKKAVEVYRHLLKIQRKCFRGDLATLNAARTKTRSEFELYRNEQDQDIIDKTIAYAKEVAIILERNVVQAVKTEKDKFEIKIGPSTEINDNDTIRKGRTKNRQVKPCSEK